MLQVVRSRQAPPSPARRLLASGRPSPSRSTSSKSPGPSAMHARMWGHQTTFVFLTCAAQSAGKLHRRVCMTRRVAGTQSGVASCCRYNAKVFGGRLPADLQISWSKHLLTTAGLTHYSRTATQDASCPHRLPNPLTWEHFLLLSSPFNQEASSRLLPRPPSRGGSLLQRPALDEQVRLTSAATMATGCARVCRRRTPMRANMHGWVRAGTGRGWSCRPRCWTTRIGWSARWRTSCATSPPGCWTTSPSRPTARWAEACSIHGNDDRRDEHGRMSLMSTTLHSCAAWPI